MDSDEVIVIEDTPPSSPDKITKKRGPTTAKQVHTRDMYHQPSSQEFPVGDQALIWTRNTTNFIKQSMNSVQQIRLPMMNNNIQNKPVKIFQLGVQNGSFLPTNGHQFNGTTNPPYTVYNFNPLYRVNTSEPIEKQQLLNGNFWMKVKLEEIPDNGEVVSQYIIDSDGTPISADQNVPEFIDINAYVVTSKMQNEPVANSETKDDTLNLSEETIDKKRKNSVPLFLKRNRPVLNKMKLAEKSQNISSPLGNTEDDDVIFIGQYKNTKNNPSKSEIEKHRAKNESVKTEINSSASSENFSNEENQENIIKTYSKTYKYGKVKRKGKNVIPVRRNPKRQVQKQKDFLKMLDNVIYESEKEERQKKISNPKSKPVKTAIKQIKRSPRVAVNSGAVYCPPSPLTDAHIRDWPTEGMHERPEYDPVSGKIQPFDSAIRKISNAYAQNETTKNAPMSHDEFLAENLENQKSFAELCHEMLHHVLSYIATVKYLDNEENKTEVAQEKVEFLEGLDLKKNGDSVENQICHILHSIVEQIATNDNIIQTENLDTPLMDLLKNSILLYCLTNNVDASDVAKYITSVKPEDIIKLSNEQFKLLPVSGN